MKFKTIVLSVFICSLVFPHTALADNDHGGGGGMTTIAENSAFADILNLSLCNCPCNCPNMSINCNKPCNQQRPYPFDCNNNPTLPGCNNP